MSRNTKIVGGVLLTAIILVAVAYAAITNVGLNINGVGNAQAKQENFKVEFVGTPTTSGKGTVSATIDKDDKTQGTVYVSDLSAKGDEGTATFTVKNLSADISADLTAEATSSNEDYFEVICSLEKTTLKAQEETSLKVSIKLLQTPIDEIQEDLNTDIEVTITAKPKQPGEEANEGASTVSSKKTTKPYLPTGFTQDKDTTLKNGLTIQDSKGNQYVWIEVPMTDEVYPTAGLKIKNFSDEEYTKIEDDLHAYTNGYRNATTNKDEYYSGIGLTSDQYSELKKTMLKSVYQNGGFYIGKYETGIEDIPKTSGSSDRVPTEIPVIKQNAYPYNNVTCGQAQILASNMESGNHTSSLMFGVQWDLVLKYFETKGTSQEDLKTDSTSWGNYANNLWKITNENLKYELSDGVNYLGWTSATEKVKDSYSNIVLSTGASDDFNKQGIYDLAGNLWEWTLERFLSSKSCAAFRGGNSLNAGYFNPAAYRAYDEVIKYSNTLGFRVSIF